MPENKMFPCRCIIYWYSFAFFLSTIGGAFAGISVTEGDISEKTRHPGVFRVSTPSVDDISIPRFIRADYAPILLKNTASEGAKLYLSFEGSVQAQKGMESDAACHYFDILGAKVDISPLVFEFASGPLRLLRLMQLSTAPPVVRATLFQRGPVASKISMIREGIEVILSPLENSRKTYGHLPQPLLKPSEYVAPKPEYYPVATKVESVERNGSSEASQSVCINLKGIKTSDLLRSLAKKTSMILHFRDPIDSVINVSLTSPTPLKAMQSIAEMVQANLSLEDGDLWVSHKNNPLLSFSEKDYVENADLRGLSLGDVLRALGRAGEINVVLDVSMETEKDKTVQVVFHRMTYRRAFETLFSLYGLRGRFIDGKTLLVLTDKAGRDSAGNILRVIPVQTSAVRLRELLKASITPQLLERVVVVENLGNLVIVGDKEAVNHVEAVLKSIESKITKAGEGYIRTIFRPLNTIPGELLRILTESLGESQMPQVSLDQRTDSLLITGPQNVVERALQTLRELDRPPTKQALIRIRLIEFSRTELKQLGISYTRKYSFDDLGKLPTKIAIPAEMQFYENSNKVKTLANPTLRCINKQEASINISEQIPVKSTITEYIPVGTANLAARSTEAWTNTDIGIVLKLIPQIHENDEISLDVNANLTELVKMVEGHPWTAQRTLQTRVRVKNAETVVIGGLIRKKNFEERSPSPILKKIPFLRSLVKAVEFRDKSDDDSEMVILITPTIVGTNAGELDKVTEHSM